MSFTGNGVRRLAGKVAVVTGGASGIGEATVKTFVASGAKVIIADVQDGPGTYLVEEVGGKDFAHYVHCDVTDEDQLAAALDSSVSVFGRLDILHNNAGMLGILGSIEKISASDWDRTTQVLLKSCFLGIKHATRILRAGNHGGSIINTASVSSVAAGWGPHCYTTCKHALVGLTSSTAAELRSYQIRVNALSPGPIFTPLLVKTVNTFEEQNRAQGQNDGPDLGLTLGDPQDIANAALFLASDESKHVSGQNLVLDGSHTITPYMPHFPNYFSDSKMVSATVKSKDSAVQ